MAAERPRGGDAALAESARRAAEMPVDLIDDETDGLLNRPDISPNADSPSKRTRWDVGAEAKVTPGQLPVTLEQLTAQLTATMAPVAGGMRQLQDRIASMENEVAAKMGPTLELIKTVDRRQKVMNDQLDDMQRRVEEQAQKSKDQDAAMQEVLRRLEVLEKERLSGQPAVWRRQGGAAPEDDREPAVIVGGWKEDSEADHTLAAVKDFIRDRAIPLPTAEAFVPGQRRGFAVIPLVPTGNETHQSMMRRAIEAVEMARKLKQPSGHQDKDGKNLVIWAAISQPPEVRRKVKLLAKSKRAILESHEKIQGQNKAGDLLVQVDYRKYVLAIEGKKVGGCDRRPPAGEILVCDHGWVDAALICEHTKETAQAFADRWHHLVDAIN